MPLWLRLTVVLSSLAIAWLLETFVPLIQFGYHKLKHASVNIVFLLTSMLVNVALAQYVSQAILHRVGYQWKRHMIHHNDTTLDATSGTRHHPGNFLWRELFSILAIIVTGMPFAFYKLYRILVTPFFTYVTHANVHVPEWLDRPLSWVFVTPNMHKFHHHESKPCTNSNYGGVLSIWDRLFGTFTYGDHKEVRYGLDVLDAARDLGLAYQFTIPFNKEIQTD
ncbi:TPA: sterol desaturase [Candidatus Latescibacteria bacterium]|nr:sterol desaturase [Candidatus Latescibacterota bacterium]